MEAVTDRPHYFADAARALASGMHLTDEGERGGQALCLVWCHGGLVVRPSGEQGDQVVLLGPDGRGEPGAEVRPGGDGLLDLFVVRPRGVGDQGDHQAVLAAER
ncbi:hypothetical protein A6A06_06025 [Streptomyces sp. CB02923]|nr:hypothetical protein A6A06_06025 [Streptomyces sp. CB02923]